ncbi:MAG: phosphatidylinositol kinase [Legionellaceae bacterium]|nr:phosphatidylinositol kinase [Legionellaceae bacterium]
MSNKSVKQVDVYLKTTDHPVKVGRLAYRDQTAYFEYDESFIQKGIELSPFTLPLKAGLQQGDPALFDGLPGLFNDSLPDGWGRLLLDRAVREEGILPDELTPLDRLTYVGEHGMGALIYYPAHEQSTDTPQQLDLDLLAKQTRQILQGDASAVIAEILELNGSSAGARPKAMIGLNNKKNIIHGANELPAGYEHWLVKFPNAVEPFDSGAIEFVYAQLAKLAGIETMETCLLPAKHGPGYFATKRFDRASQKRFHIHSACGLLHSDFRTPSMDYKTLLKATFLLTKSKNEVRKLFRLCVFNVLMHNKDDHTKNISFMINADGQWQLTPAYDLTFSSGPGGEQSTMVMGKGKHITHDDLIELALSASINKQEAQTMLDNVLSARAQWKKLASKAGVSSKSAQAIERRLNSN